MKSAVVGLVLFLSVSSLAAGPQADVRIEVPKVIRFFCQPATDLALAYGGGVMEAWGTVTVDKSSFENNMISRSVSVDQARVSVRLSYNITGGARVRDLRTLGNIRIWKGMDTKPEINIFLNPGRITVSVGEILGQRGPHPSTANVTTTYPLDCRSELY